MKTVIKATFFAAALAATTVAHAQVTVKNAWVRATVPQQQATGAFMQLASPKETTLISATSPLTPSVEVHEMTMQDNVMRMRQVPGVVVPAGKTVELAPGGYHIMLMNLKRPVKEGDTVPLTLTFRAADGKSESVKVAAEVRALNTNNSSMDHSGHKH